MPEKYVRGAGKALAMAKQASTHANTRYGYSISLVFSRYTHTHRLTASHMCPACVCVAQTRASCAARTRLIRWITATASGQATSQSQSPVTISIAVTVTFAFLRPVAISSIQSTRAAPAVLPYTPTYLPPSLPLPFAPSLSLFHAGSHFCTFVMPIMK